MFTIFNTVLLILFHHVKANLQMQSLCGIRPGFTSPFDLSLVPSSISSSTSSFPILQGRIVGGYVSTPQAWPWMISIQEHNRTTGENRHKCGASLIDRYWAITAAHCVYRKNPRRYRLYIGETLSKPFGKKIIRADRFIWHPFYVSDRFFNDIALIHFTKPVQYDSDIFPVCLAYSDTNYSRQMATAIGWGLIHEYSPLQPINLNHVALPVMTNGECAQIMMVKALHHSWLCAGYQQGGKDACQGDSGGPLVIEQDGRWNIIGIISAGRGCAQPYRPGIYTKVSLFTEWINNIISNYLA